MKAISLFLAALPLLGFSQNGKKKDINTSILDTIEHDIISKTLAPSEIHLPFRSIEVIDARFDTSKLGFELHKKHDNISYTDFKKVKLEGGTSKAIQNYYNDYYQLCLKDTGNELLIILKTLWIDNLPTGEFKERRRFDVIRESYQDIYVKLEYYLKRGNKYFPLKRIDTVYQLTEQIINSAEFKFKKNNLSFFMFTLKSLIESHDFNSLINKVNFKNSLTLKSIDSFNNKRLLLPILTADSIKRGIFLSTSDFINNTPVADSGYRFDKKGYLFRKDDKTTVVFYLFFAKEGLLYTKPSEKANIIRVGNTFELFMMNDVYLPKTAAGNLLSLIPDTKSWGTERFERSEFNTGNGARLHYILVPRQINMETGEIY